MSTTDSERAIDRIVSAYMAHGDNGGTYLLVALSILARHSAETVDFLLDRADDVAQDWGAHERDA